MKQEFQEIRSFFKKQSYILIILSVTTFSLVMQWYRPVSSLLVINYLFYYVLLPVIVIVLGLRDNPLDYGFRIGEIGIWLKYVLITIIVGFPVLYLGTRSASVQHFYLKEGLGYTQFLTFTVPELFAWEYLLRGFLLFGLKKRFGEASIIIQMVPFVLLHLGKPEAETLSCIITGLWFGWIAYRGKSFWPAFLIHVFINLTAKWFVTF